MNGTGDLRRDNPRKKALVIGFDTRSFLTVVRSLGRAGICVHVAPHERDGAAFRSRYVARAHELPHRDAESEWIAALSKLLKQEAFDLVIPCHDDAVVALQCHRDELERSGHLYTLNDEAFTVLYDKSRTVDLAHSVGVPVPQSFVLSSPTDATGPLSELEFPVVLKPVSSYDSRRPSCRRDVRKAYTEERYYQLLYEMLQDGPVLVQENVVGQGVGVDLLLDDGEPLLVFQHERVHEPLHGGGSSYRKSAAVSPDLLDAALRLLRPLSYTGVAMVEFKVNPETGRWALMEVNPRFWGSLPLSAAAGVDFPLALFRLLAEGRRPSSAIYPEGIYCRNLRDDLYWQVQNFSADHSDPTLATRPLPQVLFEAMRNTVTLREHCDTFTVDDPFPGLVEAGQIVREGGGHFYRRARQRLLYSYPVRRHLNRQAARALRRARTVTFVCTGNICRSPFAEQLARQHWTHLRSVTSAGSWPKAGRQPPDHARAAAAKWSVNIENHRSQVLSDSLVREADMILVFDQSNYRAVVQEYPFARDRVHFVGALSPAGPLFIPDPWGGSRSDFEETYGAIAQLLLQAKESCRLATAWAR